MPKKNCFNLDLKIKGFILEGNDIPVQKKWFHTFPLRSFLSITSDPRDQEVCRSCGNGKVDFLDVLQSEGIFFKSVQVSFKFCGALQRMALLLNWRTDHPGEGRKGNHVNAPSTEDLQWEDRVQSETTDNLQILSQVYREWSFTSLYILNLLGLSRGWKSSI